MFPYISLTINHLALLQSAMKKLITIIFLTLTGILSYAQDLESYFLSDFPFESLPPIPFELENCQDPIATHYTNISSSSLANNYFDSQDIVVLHGTFEVDEDFTFTHTTVFLSADAQIVIEANARLTIDNSWLRPCGDTMWNRVLVSNDAELYSYFSIYEGAKTAVEVINSGEIDFSYNYFYNNHTGLFFSGSFVPHEVQLCQFYGNGTLLYPYQNQGSEYGVKVVNAAEQIDLGYGNATNNIPNFYHDLRYGVYIRNSITVNISGSYFNNIGVVSLPGFLPNNRAAIFIDNDLTTESSIEINSNSFYNCYLGIRKNKRTTLLAVYNNHFQNIELHALYSSFANTVYVGGTPYYDQSRVHSNYVTYCGYGFTFMSGNDASIEIGGDTIINPTIFPKSHAIYVSSISDAQGEGPVNIGKNYIEGYPTGISALNQKFLRITDNVIKDVYANANLLSEGIKISNCFQAHVTCNYVIGISAQYSLAGIRSSASSKQWVVENRFERVGRAVHSNGISSNSKFLGNRFSASQIGFYLNQSVIGPQWISFMNSSGFKEFWPQDNQWIGGFSDHVFNYNSNQDLSPFRYRDNSPNTYHYPIPFINSFDNSIYLPAQPLIFIPTTSSAPMVFAPCDTTLGNIIPDDPDEHLQTQEEIVQMLDTMKYGIYTPDEAAQHWIYEQALFTELAYDTIDFSSNAYLVDFFDLASEEEIGQIENLEQLIEEVYNDSTIYASGISSALWNGWNNATYPVMNYELFYEIYINALDSRDSTLTLDQSDIEIIDSLAHLCPMVHGKAVYLARGLLDALDKPWTDNECEFGINSTGRKTDNQTSLSGVKIYPNPASSYLFVQLDEPLEESGFYEILNSQGIVLIHEIVPSGQQEIQIGLMKLTEGMYFIRYQINKYQGHEKFIKL